MMGFFNTFKLWIYGAGAALIAGFFTMFKYRGMKIDQQAQEIEAQKHHDEVMKRYYEQKEKLHQFTEQNNVEAEKAKHVDQSNITDGHYNL